MRLFNRKPSFSKQLAITPPIARADRHGIAIVSTVKNEADYIADWALFHRAVGVRHFFIYDDGSSDDSIAILRDVLRPDELTVTPWVSRMVDLSEKKPLNGQVIAFTHATLNFGSQFKWMAFIDVDEFILPKTGDTIEEALSAASGFPNVSLPWHMFGTSGHKTKPLGSVLRNYTLRGREPISGRKNVMNFKCIVDPCEVSEVSVHLFGTREFGELTSNDVGFRTTRRGRKTPKFYSAQHLQLNHYYSKSAEELRAKLARGPASPGLRSRYEERVTIAVQNIEADQIEDLAMVDFLNRTGLRLSGE